MRRVVVTGMGMVTPVGRDLETHLVGAPGRPERRRPDHALRRRDLPDPDRRRGHAASTSRTTSTMPSAGRSTAATPSSPSPRRGWRSTIRASRRARDLDRVAVRRLPRLGRGAAGLPPVRRPGQPDAQRQGKVDTAAFTRQGLRQLHPIREAEQEPGTPAGHLASLFGARGPECQLPDGLRRQLAGDRRGGRDHPPRRCRRDALGRHAQHDPPVRRDRLQPPDRPLDPQRRADPRQPAVRPRPRRLHPRRGGRACSSSRSSSTPRARGATIYGEIVGYGSTADAFRITDSHDEGRGAIACMREALADAGLNPEDVDYINAHGTSTSVNDSIETLAIKRTFGDAAYKVPISSTKSMMGHLIAAAGSVEAIVCLLTIRDGVVPPTINLDNPGPRLRPRLHPPRGPPQGGRRRALEQLRLRRPEHRPDPPPVRRLIRRADPSTRPLVRPASTIRDPDCVSRRRPPGADSDDVNGVLHVSSPSSSCVLVPLAVGSSLLGGVPRLRRDPLRADHRPDLRGEAAVPAAPARRPRPTAKTSASRPPTASSWPGTYLRATDRDPGRACSSSATST